MTDAARAQFDDGSAAFARLAAARLEMQDRPNARWFIESFYRYLGDAAQRGNGADVLRYLGLPNTPVRIKRELRDQALARAASHIEAPGAWTGCLKLAAEWSAFVSLSAWRESRQAAAPPPAIGSELRVALWWASHFDARTRLKGQPLSARGLFQIEIVTAAFSDRKCGREA